MVSGIYICHWPGRGLEYSRCEVLLHRSYHNDVPSAISVASMFSQAYLSLEEHERGPFIYFKGVSFISLCAENDILFLAVARRNVSASSAVTLLSQLQSLITHYFSENSRKMGNEDLQHYKGLTRDAIVDNYALLFELLDECVDFGLAQVTDFNILKEYIKMEVNMGKNGEICDHDSGSDSDSPSAKRKSKQAKNQRKSLAIRSTHNQAVRTDVINDAAASYINSSIVRTQVSAISWRPKGIFYPKNEIYIDIIEECEFLYDLETQSVRTNQINGMCSVRSYLSGMPLCKLGLNEKYISQVESDDVEEEFADTEFEGNQLIVAPEEQDDTEKKPKLMKVPITNVQFHSCVELSKVYKDNLIYFTPPDDEFRLFSYSVEQQRRKRAKPLLTVHPIYRVVAKANKLQVMCSLFTNFRKKLHCKKMVVRIPVNPAFFPLDNSNEHNFRFKCEMGEVRFSVDSSEILWAISDLPGSKKCVKLMAEISLSETSHLSAELFAAAFSGKPFLGNSNGRPLGPLGNTDKTWDDSENGDSTISELDKYYGVGQASSSVFTHLQQSANKMKHEIAISFEMPLFTYSGLKVTYLRVDEDTMKYTCFPWVRYATRASADGSTSGLQNTPAAQFRFKLGPSNFSVI
ncbi:hypothetical protein OXX79_000380 [Metschnikowia pulcherrima]